ncbi:uncharacterized protein LOC113005043 [Solenopsis invicta]|uniref:uncharacterized protein LOC113005043 n=1 Tax=Solenopsis invicta TaxID=13686 RepID=UPI00193D518B|nr:uncharacterized protein LOC113005043 [Solenopsis invicta]
MEEELTNTTAVLRDARKALRTAIARAKAVTWEDMLSELDRDPWGLVELLGKYDVTMHEHLRRISSQETHVHYCSNTIQNEIIILMGSSVKNTILDRARQAKYYSIILDCTPDLSHTEQLSVTIRFVDVSSDVSPKEHFITFRAVHESSGQSLFDIILKVLEKLNLDIKDCRGQGYDNGSNMKGNNTASVGRWKILINTVPAFTIKPLCTTRWESRIECLKPLRYQVIEIHDALLTLSEHGSSDPAIKHEAQTLASQLCVYNFLVILVIWYDILFRINIVSKSMQSNTMDLGSAVSLMESCAEYIENYRLNGFAKALVDAKELAKSLDVDPIFVQKRVNRKKRMFNYEHSDETMSDPQNLFKTKIFYVILDTAITSLKERFKQLKEFQDTWFFLFDISKLPEIEELKKCCSNLEDKLRHGNNYDILGNELYDELQSTSSLISKNIHDPLNVLKFINQNNLQSVLSNLWTALRILLTIPITVASGERSFSKLKLIKTYLRTSTSDDRLSVLAILSIENEITQKIDLAKVIKSLWDLKARKKSF